MKKRLLSWLLVLTMVTSLIPSTLVTALAADLPSAQASGQAGKTKAETTLWLDDLSADITDFLVSGTIIPNETLTVENGETLIVHGSGTLSGNGRTKYTPFFIVKDGGHLVLDQVTISENRSTSGTVVVEKGGLLDLGYNDQKDRIAPSITGNRHPQVNVAKNLVIADGATVRLNAATTRTIGISYADDISKTTPKALVEGGRYTLVDSDATNIISDINTAETMILYDNIVLRYHKAKFLFFDPEQWFGNNNFSYLSNFQAGCFSSSGAEVTEVKGTPNAPANLTSVDNIMQYDVIMLCGPYPNYYGTEHDLDQAEYNLLAEFINNGGRVIIQAEDALPGNPFNNTINPVATKIARNLGAGFTIVYEIDGKQSYIGITTDMRVISGPLTDGLSNFQVGNASPILVDEDVISTTLFEGKSSDGKYRSFCEDMQAGTRADGSKWGNIMVLADADLWTYRGYGPDPARFAKNILDNSRSNRACAATGYNPNEKFTEWQANYYYYY